MPKIKSETYLERKKTKMFEKFDLWQGRIARLLVILMLCAVPIYFNTDRYIRLTGHKFWFFFTCMCVVLFGVLVVWAARLLLSEPRLLPRDKLFIIDWAVLGFAVVTLLSALMSPFKDEVNVWLGIQEPGGRYDGAITQLLYVAVYFIVSRWYKPRERDFTWFGVSAVLIALIGIFQFYGMDFFNLWPNHIAQYYRENYYYIYFRSTLGNINIVSTYVCIANLLCGFSYIKIKSRWRYLLLAGSALSFWLMVLAGSFSGMVGTLAATIMAVPFIVENRRSLGRFFILGASWIAAFTLQTLFFQALILEARTVASLIPFMAAACILLAAGVILLLFCKKAPEPDPDGPINWKPGVILLAAIIIVALVGIEVLGRSESTALIYQARQVMHGNIDDTFGSNRIFIWRNALTAVPQFPVIGSGPDTFYYAFPADMHGFYGEAYDKAHNEYLQILICQGILGFLFYLVFLGGLFIKSVPKAFNNPMFAAVLVAFMGYSVQAFFNINLPIVSQSLWIFAGMMANKQFREMAVGELREES